ncbi:MAG: amidohydrolase family protein [Clostridiales bacterium]|nr:amidohydrolase family protein [Clostridiales bacterium]
MLIVNGRIHDGLGTVRREDLRMAEGRISQIGENLCPEDGEEVFDAADMEILPGFVQAISQWGVNGSMQEIRPSANDNDETSNPITPELDGFYAFNGRAATAQQLGAFGLTVCGIAPSDNNLFGGTIAAFEVDGVNPYKMCLKRDIGMMASVTEHLKQTYRMRPAAPQTRMWIFANFAEQLRKASAYKTEPGKPADEKLAALRRVVEGELPLFVSCDSKVAAERVREIVEHYPKLRLVLVNGFGLEGTEEWVIERNIPVIVRTAAFPLDESAMTLDLEAIAQLVRQGIPVALSGTYTNSLSAREDMLWNGIEMMKLLHDSEAVLPMLTSVPARILGLDDLTGTLEPGKRADLVIWSANPLETWQANVVHTYQGGRLIYQEGDEMKCM